MAKKDLGDIGLIGLAVMGENLALNFESKGFRVAVFNRTTSKVDAFINGRAKGKNFIGAHSLQELCQNLKTPRKIIMMVMAGKPVDEQMDALMPFCEAGDIFIDGGNSEFQDSNRRQKYCEGKGFLFIGTGVSGGEEGALKGPSIMPGGSPAAWPHVKELFQRISAKVADSVPCCEWVGAGGAGHYVKTVHNGIEYGDIQLIGEAYFLMKKLLGLDNEKLHAIFEEWNKGDLDSYLIEITRDILGKKDDEDSSKYTLDLILDTAGQKGTGKWTAISALDLGQPVTLIGEAVFARCLSAAKDARVRSSKLLEGPAESSEFKNSKDQKAIIEAIRQALYASKLVSYAQGFVLIKAASEEYKWNIDYGSVALMWRGGCIIRSTFLGEIKKAFEKNKELENLLLDNFFLKKIADCQKGWRQVISIAALNGIAVPAMGAALAYYDGLRTESGPANLLQAQRDYFGAHTYQRIDRPRDKFFHTNWTGRGGTTSSTTYNR